MERRSGETQEGVEWGRDGRNIPPPATIWPPLKCNSGIAAHRLESFDT